MKHHILYHILPLVIAFGICSTGWSQTIMAGIDRNKIVIGEQVQLVVAVENGKGISGWINLPDSINHIEVVARQKIDTIKIANIINYRQVITITSFDSGQWQIPPLSVNGISKSTPPITIDVLPVDVSHLDDYHDIKDIIEVQVGTSWMVIAAIALLTLLSIIIIYWLYKKKRKVVTRAPVLTGTQTPLDWAMDELDKLQQQQLYVQRQEKKHYSKLVDIARSYFHVQLHHQSLHLTTEEWMLQLQSVDADNEIKISFFQLLRLADTVKFAKYIPPAAENDKSVEVARNFIKNVASANAHAAYQPKKN